MTNEYNGWTNYETWNFNLWITNTEADYGYALKMAFDCQNEYDLSKRLEEWAIEMADNALNSHEYEHGFISDMVNSSIKQVNFYEVAKHLWDEIHDEEEE